jgi:hypothetical protein
MSKSSNEIAMAESKVALDTILKLKDEQDAIKNAPFVLDFGTDYETELIVPIKKKITGKLLDTLIPIQRKYRANMAQEFINQLVEHTDLPSRDKFDKLKKNKDIDTATLHVNYTTLWITKAREVLVPDMDSGYIYNADEFELFLSPKDPIDIPQRREDFDRDVKYLQHIIDFSAINTKDEFKDLKNIMAKTDTDQINVVQLLMTGSEFDFWQSQDYKEVRRIVGKFRSDNKQGNR